MPGIQPLEHADDEEARAGVFGGALGRDHALFDHSALALPASSSLEVIFASMSDIGVIYDRDGRVVSANPPGKSLVGFGTSICVSPRCCFSITCAWSVNLPMPSSP